MTLIRFLAFSICLLAVLVSTESLALRCWLNLTLLDQMQVVSNFVDLTAIVAAQTCRLARWWRPIHSIDDPFFFPGTFCYLWNVTRAKASATDGSTTNLRRRLMRDFKLRL